MQRRSLQGLSDLDNPEVDPVTGEPVPKKTLASIAAEQDTERKRALKASGVSEQGFNERITELTGQASQARQDRDVDRWMAAAQGFFAMGAGGSRFAMQNMAEGLGIGTKQLQAAEKEYRVGEKARLDSIGVLKQAQRAEVLGNQKDAANSFEKYETLQEREKESKRRTLEHLGLVAAQQETGLATKEMQAQQARDAALARTAEARYRSDAVAESRRQSQEEIKRRNEEVERQRFATFQLTAEKQHKYNQKGSPLDTALGELEIVQSKLAAKGKSNDPDLLTQEAALKTRIGGYNDAIANDSAAKAKRMMGAGNSEWGTLQTTGGKK